LYSFKLQTSDAQITVTFILKQTHLIMKNNRDLCKRKIVPVFRYHAMKAYGGLEL